MFRIYFSILLILILSFNYNITDADSTEIDLDKYEQLYKNGKYEIIIKDLIEFINECEQWAKRNEDGEGNESTDYTDEVYIHARNLIADSYVMLGKFSKARMWYAGTSEGFFDPHATYCYEVITKVSVRLKSYDPSFDYYSVNPESTREEILLRVLRKILDNKLSIIEKRQYFKKISSEKFINNNGEISQLLKYYARYITLDELLSKVTKENNSIINLYIGLNLEAEGKIKDACIFYRKALEDKDLSDIELLLANSRLGLLAINDFSKKGESVNPINDTILYAIRVSSAKYDDKLYPVQNLIDNNSQTAWVPDNNKSGIGEWAELSFDDPVWINSLTLTNGYTKNDVVFKNNNRIKTATLNFSDGSKTKISLNDSMKPQVIKVNKKSRTIRLVIDEVYKGTKYDDTCLSGADIDLNP